MSASDFASAGRVVPLVFNETISAGGTPTSATIDCKGWRWALVVLVTGTVAATADGTFTVQDGAASNGSDAANITGATFTIEDTDDGVSKQGLIDLHRRSRYLTLDGTSGTGGSTPLTAFVVLYGCKNSSQYVNAGTGEADELEFTVLT